MSGIASGATSLRMGHASRAGKRDTFDFAALIDAIWRGLPVLCLWVVICWMFAAVVLLRTPVQYTASTQVALESIPKKQNSSTRDTPLSVLDVAQAETRVQALKGERLLRFVFDSLKVKDFPEFRPQPPSLLHRILHPFRGEEDADSPEAQTAAFMSFMDKVSAHRLGLSYVMEISYVAPTPQGAAAMANAITSAYIRDRVLASEKDEEILERRISEIKRQAELLTAGMLKGVVPEGEFPEADARVISAAITPLAKSSPKTALTFAFATVFATLTGLGMIAFRHRSDRTLRTARQVRAATALACVATLPRIPEAGTWTGEGRIALRRLFVRLRTASASERAVGFLACKAGSGTSSICYELARGLTGEGRRVVLIDANLRRAFSSQVFNADGQDSLSELLAREDLRGCTEKLPTIGGIRVLASRGSEHQAERIATSPRLQPLIAEIAKEASVIVDLPALNTLDMMLQVARALAGVYLVVEAGVTTEDEANEALLLMQESGVAPLGVILTKMGAKASLREAALSTLRSIKGRRLRGAKATEGRIIAAG